MQATLPIFNGGALRADLNRSTLRASPGRDGGAMRSSRTSRRAFASRSSRSANSYAGDRTGRRRREGVGRANLRIVTDSYSNGAVSIITLIDAQNAALASDLAAAEAKYLYLGDIIECCA